MTTPTLTFSRLGEGRYEASSNAHTYLLMRLNGLYVIYHYGPDGAPERLGDRIRLADARFVARRHFAEQA